MLFRSAASVGAFANNVVASTSASPSSSAAAASVSGNGDDVWGEMNVFYFVSSQT